jgi:hypothetical protein
VGWVYRQVKSSGCTVKELSELREAGVGVRGHVAKEREHIAVGSGRIGRTEGERAGAHGGVKGHVSCVHWRTEGERAGAH